MKTYLLILGLSAALATGLPGHGGQRSTCERLVFHGRAQALSLKDEALAYPPGGERPILIL